MVAKEIVKKAYEAFGKGDMLGKGMEITWLK